MIDDHEVRLFQFITNLCAFLKKVEENDPLIPVSQVFQATKISVFSGDTKSPEDPCRPVVRRFLLAPTCFLLKKNPCKNRTKNWVNVSLYVSRTGMIKRHSLTLLTSRFALLNRFCHPKSCFMATPADFLVNQRHFQMLSLRRLSTNASVSSASDIREMRFRKGFGLKGCCSENFRKILWNNNGNVDSCGLQKAMVFPRLLCVSEEVVRVEDQEKGLSSKVFNDVLIGSSGSLIGSSEKRLPEKIMVAVDVDEVLGNFVSALNQFIADRYSQSHSISEYHVYEFFKIWNCSRDEADIRVHEFFKTSYFKKGIHPIPGARKALQNLSESCNLSIVTSRQNAIKEHTIEWVEKHYPDLFQEIHFGNHFALDGQSRPKSDICRSLGAKVLIDDNPRYAIECAEVGIKVLLFDYQNSYPWCKMENICQHPLVTKVHNWEEVENQLASSIVS